jgi:hypothetical protein
VIDSDVTIAFSMGLGAKFQAIYQHNKIIVTREEDDHDVRAVVFRTAARFNLGEGKPERTTVPVQTAHQRNRRVPVRSTGMPLQVMADQPESARRFVLRLTGAQPFRKSWRTFYPSGLTGFPLSALLPLAFLLS